VPPTPPKINTQNTITNTNKVVVVAVGVGTSI
jgi:hypothetical protein